MQFSISLALKFSFAIGTRDDWFKDKDGSICDSSGWGGGDGSICDGSGWGRGDDFAEVMWSIVQGRCILVWVQGPKSEIHSPSPPKIGFHDIC